MADDSYLTIKLNETYAPFPPPTSVTEAYALKILDFIQELGVQDKGIIAVATPQGTKITTVYVALSAGLLSGLTEKIKGGYSAIEKRMQQGFEKVSLRLCTDISLVKQHCKRPSCAEPKILSEIVKLGKKIGSLCVIGFPDNEIEGYVVIGTSNTTYLHPCQDCKNLGGSHSERLK
ncbi:hypothetical protein AB4Y45_44925 [Paraburkholderia sp. EG287A]|uniref:hypothetical protein n=1 Tax=unclassified Paraburkholderia TaxID=2615204 RepID=UPI0034D2389F